jgi:tRNA A-37 threonylcarbamoyl transferase component Bud32
VLGERVNNFEIVRLLGEGGMGAVYEAEHLLIRRRVAIKVLKAELVVDGELVQRFFNEARATSAIRHPNIVEVVDVGRLVGGVPYLIMELLEGESLAQRLDRLTRLELSDALDFVDQAASALEAAHRAGIVHRDLKPENLFLVPDQRFAQRELVKVLDFGIAKLCGDMAATPVRTMAGAVFGTPPYMSPEQCRGRPSELDQRTDIYALGIILYEALCGRPPFEAESLGELMLMHMNAEPEPPSRLRAEVSPPLEAALLRALAKKRDQRYASMVEFASALRKAAPRAARANVLRSSWPAGSAPDLEADGGGDGEAEAPTTLWRAPQRSACAPVPAADGGWEDAAQGRGAEESRDATRAEAAAWTAGRATPRTGAEPAATRAEPAAGTAGRATPRTGAEPAATLLGALAVGDGRPALRSPERRHSFTPNEILAAAHGGGPGAVQALAAAPPQTDVAGASSESGTHAIAEVTRPHGAGALSSGTFAGAALQVGARAVDAQAARPLSDPTRDAEGSGTVPRESSTPAASGARETSAPAASGVRDAGRRLPLSAALAAAIALVCGLLGWAARRPEQQVATNAATHASGEQAPPASVFMPPLAAVQPPGEPAAAAADPPELQAELDEPSPARAPALKATSSAPAARTGAQVPPSEARARQAASSHARAAGPARAGPEARLAATLARANVATAHGRARSTESADAAPRANTAGDGQRERAGGPGAAHAEPAAEGGGVAEPGFLSLDTAPWSEVFLGPTWLGTTPIIKVPLPPGRHLLTLKNSELSASGSYVVEIKSGRTVSRLIGWAQ